MSTPTIKPTWSIRQLHAVNDGQIEGLADVLIDCVEGGASVSFMLPLTRDRAVAFWQPVAQGVATGDRALLVAEDQQGLCGTVQLNFDMPENQPHRADLAKMLVHRRVRRQGLGAALMKAAEETARQCGKTLLVLDAVTNGDAARLYERLGWVRVGDVPSFALMPRGEPCSTTYYYRDLADPVPAAGLETSSSMQAIQYRIGPHVTLPGVLDLYRANGWSAAEKPQQLLSALLGSHSLVSAWDGERLVGLGNAITDGHLVVYYPHLLVHPEYQGRGVGTHLVRMLIARYAGFHQHILVADGKAIEFYRKCGFERAGQTEPMWIYAGDDH